MLAEQAPPLDLSSNAAGIVAALRAHELIMEEEQEEYLELLRR